MCYLRNPFSAYLCGQDGWIIPSSIFRVYVPRLCLGLPKRNKEFGQYPAILTFRLVDNVYLWMRSWFCRKVVSNYKTNTFAKTLSQAAKHMIVFVMFCCVNVHNASLLGSSTTIYLHDIFGRPAKRSGEGICFVVWKRTVLYVS